MVDKLRILIIWLANFTRAGGPWNTVGGCWSTLEFLTSPLPQHLNQLSLWFSLLTFWMSIECILQFFKCCRGSMNWSLSLPSNGMKIVIALICNRNEYLAFIINRYRNRLWCSCLHTNKINFYPTRGTIRFHTAVGRLNYLKQRHSWINSKDKCVLFTSIHAC